MKFRHWGLAAGLLAASLGSGVAQADPAGRVAVYIAPQYYDHEVKLWHFYYSYWVNQGQALEQPALEAFKPAFAETDLCHARGTADVVVELKPHLFYNPHMTTYFADVKATVFSGSGKPLGIYKGEAQTLGFLDVVPAAKVHQVYRQAMNDLVKHIQADATVMSLAQKGLPESETKMPCEMASVLPTK
ncbi:uncharacterized protein NMK_3444 [Novimethylophilus kurashikiensis]|uniref:Uncharacterized protein n=1 Tax=Novimethylophilus kurashikiensis TaxID=1825523 RepID=A0A2R5FC90_9PROT|nr:hypothetical protein [Novimethylophilus kurashikiensis]GBG15832.1 uncharacterized protein NMK_3444 [Novimethylophilus kurashikiensis]